MTISLATKGMLGGSTTIINRYEMNCLNVAVELQNLNVNVQLDDLNVNVEIEQIEV